MNPGDPALTRIAVQFWAETGRRTTLPARGFSMWPVLRSGEAVSVRHGGARPRVGDIIIVMDGDRAVAHRVIAMGGSAAQPSYLTKGDTCLTADRQRATTDRIVGVIEGVVKGDVVLKRFGIEGRWAYRMALVSRAQGFLCAPLGLIVERLFGGRTCLPGPRR